MKNLPFSVNMQVLYHKKVEKGTINSTNVNILNVKIIKKQYMY